MTKKPAGKAGLRDVFIIMIDIVVYILGKGNLYVCLCQSPDRT